jgi:hypothetical protein
MGFSLSWIAFKGITKQTSMARLGLVDTAEPDECCESAAAGALLPSGWFLVQLRDCFHPFLRHEALARLSESCEVLGCQAEEHVMASASFLWVGGKQAWSITHESENGIYDLAVAGSPPVLFASIQARVCAEQDAEGGEEADVDFVYEAPIELAAELTGYRHDQLYETKSGPPFVPKYSFTRLVVANA